MKHSSSELVDPAGAAGNSRPTPLFREALRFLPLAAEAHRPLLAIDLGQAFESLDLLDLGWTVVALTEKPTVSRRRSVRLTVEVVDFRSLVLPRADLVYAGAALSLRPARDLGPVWSRIVPALRPGGWFVGRFVGDRDDRARNPDLTFLTRKQVVTLLGGFRIELLRERENGTRHEFDVIAGRRAR